MFPDRSLQHARSKAVASMGCSDDLCLFLSEGFAGATNFFAKDRLLPGILVFFNDLLNSPL